MQKQGWIDNADSWLCPVCGFETPNPNRYNHAQCPRCGFRPRTPQEPNAVRIIRCRDCRFSTPLQYGAEKYICQDFLLCSIDRGEPVLGFSVIPPDGFCNNGELSP